MSPRLEHIQRQNARDSAIGRSPGKCSVADCCAEITALQDRPRFRGWFQNLPAPDQLRFADGEWTYFTEFRQKANKVHQLSLCQRVRQAFWHEGAPDGLLFDRLCRNSDFPVFRIAENQLGSR